MPARSAAKFGARRAAGDRRADHALAEQVIEHRLVCGGQSRSAPAYLARANSNGLMTTSANTDPKRFHRSLHGWCNPARTGPGGVLHEARHQRGPAAIDQEADAGDHCQGKKRGLSFDRLAERSMTGRGGGGFRHRLAPSLLEKDRWGTWALSRDHNPAMLAEAVCKLMGFTYEPSARRTTGNTAAHPRQISSTSRPEPDPRAASGNLGGRR